MSKVIIIGAGPAGLSCARILAEKGFEVEIFESDSQVGGMSKSFELFSQIVDIGPHRFFSKDKRINDFWLSHTYGEFEQVSRLTRIFYQRKFFYYPLRGFDALFKLGVFESCLCVLSFLRAKIFKAIKTDKKVTGGGAREL
ncbi:FAD-dependent oxidoreductase [Helicobacter sp. MIT 05-5293]|uniref:FAD-dependent oxidoreductase n=1 Tax=Helicobacter sp. MIT 05-5293 TaxID=1548149 RepID=UPI000A44FBAD|nr:FAD-dependent oxidoreductase [Helicobacter sp. MIT 05-5293]